MGSKEIKLEVCVDSIASAVVAAEGGASRIELCSALTEGGLTPSCGTLKALKDLPLAIPIFCMLRPRRGNDFVYSQLEMNALCKDLELLRAHGADGFVFGALTSEHCIDVEKCRRVVQRAAGLPCTFHRAFDLTNPTEMHSTLDRLKEIGYRRLLSSGFRQSAADGANFLSQLVARHHRDIIVMPGAGITVGNLDEILTITKCIEFHASCQAAAADGEVNTPAGTRMECDVAMSRHDIEPYSIADVNVVRKMVTMAMSANL